MVKNYFCCDIRIDPKPQKITLPTLSYNACAYVIRGREETMYICEDKWLNHSEKSNILELTKLFGHETIHGILYKEDLSSSTYDCIQIPFMNRLKRECPKTWRDWFLF